MRLIYKCGGSTPRKKALFGIDALLNAGAAITSAAIQAKASREAAKEQAKAVLDNARINSEAVKAQTENNTRLQEQAMNNQINIAKEQNDLIKEFQVTNQMISGNDQNTDRLIANKIIARNGIGLQLPNNMLGSPFVITDGGQAIPLQVDTQGYGLYELQGNDHEHYHKTKNGKYKSGVGVKLPTGETIEAEGNQNTNNGEKMLVTPNNIQFISKHSIKGFNPSKAVDNGMNPQQAFNIQELIKQRYGISNDGKRMDIGGILRPDTFTDYTGAAITTAGNLGAAAILGLNNHFIGNYMTPKFKRAADITADAADKMTTINGDYSSKFLDNTGQALAVIRSANTNVNPQLERNRRQVAAQQELVDNNTLSSAARIQRLATLIDRGAQNASEIYANKYNMDEKIKQQNAETATQVNMQNAELATKNRELVARYEFEKDKYNNDINNSKIAMKAQAYIDKVMNPANLVSQLATNTTSNYANAIASSANAFASAYSNGQKTKNEFYSVMSGKDAAGIADSLILRNDRPMAERMFESRKNSTNADDIKMCTRLANKFGFEYTAPKKYKFKSFNENNFVGPQLPNYGFVGPTINS